MQDESKESCPFLKVLGNIDLLRFITAFQSGLLFYDPRFCESWTAEWAAYRGYLSLIVAKKDIMTITATAMDEAAGAGHLNVVKWLHVNSPSGCTSVAMKYAAAGGHLHVVQWLFENRRWERACMREAMHQATMDLQVHVVDWIWKKRETIFYRSDWEAVENLRNLCHMRASRNQLWFPSLG